MKAQSAIESAMVISFMFFVFTTFLVLVSSQYVRIQEEKDRQFIRDVGDAIQNEVDLSLLAENGYSRQFNLPVKLGYKNYTINFTPAYVFGSNISEVSIKYINRSKTFEHVLFLPRNVDGTILKGKNDVRKEGGMVCFNKVVCP